MPDIDNWTHVILVTTATTRSDVLFSSRCPYERRKLKFWPVLGIFGYFVTNLHNFYDPQ